MMSLSAELLTITRRGGSVHFLPVGDGNDLLLRINLYGKVVNHVVGAAPLDNAHCPDDLLAAELGYEIKRIGRDSALRRPVVGQTDEDPTVTSNTVRTRALGKRSKMSVHETIKELLRTMTPDRSVVGRSIGRTPAALYAWSVGRRSPKPDAMRALVAAARSQAARLTELANTLDPVKSATKEGHPWPTEDIIAAARNGYRINAIKMYRARYGLGLAESKGVIDEVVPLPKGTI